MDYILQYTEAIQVTESTLLKCTTAFSHMQTLCYKPSSLSIMLLCHSTLKAQLSLLKLTSTLMEVIYQVLFMP
uniref:Uncharacterized protein n=1 Tax=Anguilla anguilla TaxID=7936 RepID=A0A0E9S5L8_ANGAN